MIIRYRGPFGISAPQNPSSWPKDFPRSTLQYLWRIYAPAPHIDILLVVQFSVCARVRVWGSDGLFLRLMI